MAAKVGYEVCAWINGQQSIVGALIKDTGVLKSQWLGNNEAWSLQWSQPGPKWKATPLQYQVETMVSSSSRLVLPVMFRTRFCMAVKGTTTWFPWKLISVPMVSLATAQTKKIIIEIHTAFQPSVLLYFCTVFYYFILTSGSRSHIKHSWFQHRVVSQQVQYCSLTEPTVRVNQQSIKPYHIHTTVCCSAVDYCQYSVITVQSYPTTRSQLVAIVVPGQSSEEVTEVDIVVGVWVVLDIDIHDRHFQCYVLTWYMLHSACTINIQQICMEMDFNKRRMTLAASNHAEIFVPTTGKLDLQSKQQSIGYTENPFKRHGQILC